MATIGDPNLPASNRTVLEEVRATVGDQKDNKADLVAGKVPAGQLPSVISGGLALTRTGVKTANYTAVAGDLVPCDATAGTFTVTLPNAPADKAAVEVKIITAAAPYAVSVACAGADTINRSTSSPATTMSLKLPGEGVLVVYDAATKVWTVLSRDLALSQLDLRFPRPTSKGKIVFIVDDENISHLDAAARLEAVGGKLNLAVFTDAIGQSAGQLSAAQITDLYQRGHQVMNHSKAHPNMTTQTAAQRMAEWDDSKTILEGLTAVGAITDFVFPNNAMNLQLMQEGYGRYARLFSGTGPSSYFFTPGETGPSIGRFTWGISTHQQMLAWIKRIAVSGETFVPFCHQTDTAGASSVSTAMLQEAIDLATSLGVRFARADEAIPAQGSFFDPGFESGDLTGIYHSITTKLGAAVIDIVTDAPVAGLPGTKSLRIVGDGTAGTNRVALQGTPLIARTTEEWTLSGRVRQDKTSGTGGAQLIVRQTDEFGANLGDTSTTVLNTGGTGITAWTQLSIAFTPNKLTRGLTVWCAQPAMVGTSWFDHIDLRPTRYGVLG